ncbi:uncharacterized protein LOC132211232 isoform X2 [Myotis daubentonii]|uniref:uncharacterized protein LOC132211232 isoform X2 n=1 Tax=Myotis daubentonii TaxID=98922 RepID=UPI002873DD12|nr:uncharacterized protein LOC132211232 isoform X2 [Myotis daubentonii]
MPPAVVFIRVHRGPQAGQVECGDGLGPPAEDRGSQAVCGSDVTARMPPSPVKWTLAAGCPGRCRPHCSSLQGLGCLVLGWSWVAPGLASDWHSLTPGFGTVSPPASRWHLSGKWAFNKQVPNECRVQPVSLLSKVRHKEEDASLEALGRVEVLPALTWEGTVLGHGPEVPGGSCLCVGGKAPAASVPFDKCWLQPLLCTQVGPSPHGWE